MVVAGEGVYKTEEFMAGCGIYDEVDPRQRETVLWACSVDVSEVDVESPLAVYFFNKYDVGQPFRIFYLFAWRSLPTSSLIAFCLSSAKLLIFCLIGLKDALKFSL